MKKRIPIMLNIGSGTSYYRCISEVALQIISSFSCIVKGLWHNQHTHN